MSQAVLDLQVVKRDGRVVPFDRTRIERAIERVFDEVYHDEPSARPSVKRHWIMTDHVVNEIQANQAGAGMDPTVEQIQDYVERELMEEGHYDAAKAYILYRAEHAKQRDERPIPPEVKAAFVESARYFPTPLQQFQFFDKYSRYNRDLGRRETWVETVDRSVSFLHELAGDRLPPETYQRIRSGILEMRVMPSMRLLAMAGAPARRNSMSIYNCFAGYTQFVTDAGIERLANHVGRTVNVLTRDGVYRPAKVESFGFQPLQRITLKHWNGGKAGSFEHVLDATPDHRWILRDGTETTSLKVGDKLVAPDLTNQIVPDEEAIRHGFVYGDGTINRQKGVEYVQVRLCGKKAEEIGSYFEGFNRSYPPSYNGDPVIYCGSDKAHWKRTPDPHMLTPEYVAGFIKGLEIADGHRTSCNNLRIDTQNAVLVFWLHKNAPMAGYKVLSVREYDGETNYGPRTAPLNQVLLGTGETAIFRVESIEPLETEEVFCVVEPETGTFVLGNGQVTGNCSYMACNSLDCFPEALLISMAGCGVGYSVESKYTDQLPTIKPLRTITLTMVIEDSAEGWADALRTGIEHWFDGCDISFDYSLIRPAGSPLLTKGGRASGPDPLMKMLDFCRDRILSRQGRRLRPIDVHDMMCMVGSAAVSGGVRRTAMISLFDEGDAEMRSAKRPGFEAEHNYRWNANNSAVRSSASMSDQTEFITGFMEMITSGNGEPGIFSREVANALRPRRRAEAEFGCNPCGEILLRSEQFCNLSAAVVRATDDFESLAEKVELATIIGAIQSLATTFPGLRPSWKANCEAERLLGVDITGQMDNPALLTPNHFSALRQTANWHAARTAERLGIVKPAAITCVKPSGNTSQLVDCASGLHARWAPFYIRNVRVSASSPLYRVLRDAGAPLAPENGDDPDNPRTYVCSFPVRAPSGARTRLSRSAVEQCEWWLRNKRYYTEHNPSVTITYRPDEVLELMTWVYEHRDKIGGMAFLPSFDAKYDQLPYIEIDQEEYERRVAEFPEIDFSKIYRYEQGDLSTASTTGACEGPVCLLNE